MDGAILRKGERQRRNYLRRGLRRVELVQTSAPNTVFAVLVENGVYKDPYFGMNLGSVPGVSYPIGGQFANLEMPSDSPYAVPSWYRKEFEVPAQFSGKTVWLAFHGINYRANIWINGKKLAGSDQVVGAFRRYEFNVTPFVKPGAKNVVAVEVSAPHANELGITWVDWNPTRPIRTWASGKRWFSSRVARLPCGTPQSKRNSISRQRTQRT